jgi:hypothetical protein
MALLRLDSFDHYATADITEKHTDAGSGTISTTGLGRCGTEAYINSTSGSALRTGVTNTDETGVVGVAFWPGQLNSGGGIEIGDADNDILCFLVFAADGSLQLWTGPNIVIGNLEATSAAGLLSDNIWSYIEFKWRIHDTLGTLEVQHNGVSVASASGLDTIPADNGLYTPRPPWRQTNLITAGAAGRFDDLYILNGAGGVNDDFLGDVHVEALLAELDSVAGGGTYKQWTASSGTDMGAMVDEEPPDDDTTTLSESTTTERVTVTHPDITLASGTVYGLQAVVNAKKDNTSLGTRTIANVIVSGATTDDGATQSLTTDYKFFMEIHDVDPNTAVAWTVAGVNAVESGIQLVA